jgi:hypothetical protein
MVPVCVISVKLLHVYVTGVNTGGNIFFAASVMLISVVALTTPSKTR